MYPLLFKQIEELEGYLEQLKADLRVAQQRHQAAVEEVRGGYFYQTLVFSVTFTSV